MKKKLCCTEKKKKKKIAEFVSTFELAITTIEVTSKSTLLLCST